MIAHIIPTNIDDRLLSKGADALSAGGLVALPTDTSWSIVCSYKSKDGIKKLRAISRERDEQRFTLLCSELSQVSDLCNFDNSRFRLINRLTPGPYVFILKTLPMTEKALSLPRREIGIRIPDNPVPIALIKALGTPLYSITAKRTMLSPPMEEDGDEPEAALFDNGWELEDIAGLDLIFDGGEDQARLFSTVLDVSGDEATVIRVGAGAWPR
ncbi:MAG: L-threonylcarbamoyladenylate synthase [Treponema sp.]|jgi:tRNA threonylcarbamoyl adenosine modification protein (Sua5/YciO/YrdC/YwlC family)|nr:L-threonylcarbamoyladenylate synthase [Treponema sp.]